MLVYILLFFMMSIGAFFDLTNIKKRYKVLLFCCFGIVLIFLSAIRWETGTDWDQYLSYFTINDTFDEFDDSVFESGYAFFNYFIKNITAEYNILLFFMACGIVVMKFSCIYSYAMFPLISLLVNFSNNIGDLFSVRQSIAIAIALGSTHFIVGKKKIAFLAAIILAASFHRTALIFLPAYLIYHLHFKRRTLCAIVIFSIIIGSTDLIVIAIEGVLSYFISSDYIAVLKIADYLEAADQGENFGSAVSSQIALIGGIARRCLLLPILIFYRVEFLKLYSKFNGFLNLMIFGCFFYFLFSNVSFVIAGRGSAYYSMYEIFVIPCLFLFVKDNYRGKILLYIIFSCYCLFKYLYGLYGYYELYVPFITIFDNVSR